MREIFPDFMPLGATKHEGVITFSLSQELRQTASDYLTVREREGRLLEDGLVANLPDLPAKHPLHQEFALRTLSAKRLRKWLDRHEPDGRVLELGCGNGWLLRYLVNDSERTGMGVDINRPELEQAARVFEDDPILWVLGDVFDPLFPDQFVDVIIVASAVQYFANLPRLIERLLELLRPTGSIHFIDSHWYHSEQQESAVDRSLEYYQRQGIPAMAQHYHHHTTESLQPYHWELAYNPHSLKNRLSRKFGQTVNPFPWIMFHK